MLTLSEPQQRALAHAVFTDRMARLLHEQFPLDCPDRHDPQLRLFVRTQFDLAQGHGLDTEREVAIFIMAGWLLGPGFDHSVPAIAECLARPDLSAGEKAEIIASFTETLFSLFEV